MCTKRPACSLYGQPSAPALKGCPTKLYESDCGRIPSYYTNLSTQIICPMNRVFFHVNGAPQSTDTTLTEFNDGLIRILKDGYYEVRFILFVRRIDANTTVCGSTAMCGTTTCGLPTFSFAINGVVQKNMTYTAASAGQLVGMGIVELHAMDTISIVNTSKCAVTLGDYSATDPQTRGDCGLGSSNASVILTYRGAPNKNCREISCK